MAFGSVAWLFAALGIPFPEVSVLLLTFVPVAEWVARLPNTEWEVLFRRLLLAQRASLNTRFEDGAGRGEREPSRAAVPPLGL